ncbi:MAG: hypothetical protein L3I99_07460 [Sulfurimonas sp.]|nr:hypothetical protein [Sulfurimonas sp.]
MNKELSINAVKRVEIIVSHNILTEILKKLDELHVTGYTLIQEVAGKGDRGVVSLSSVRVGTYANSYIIISCNAQTAENIAKEIYVYLSKYGGICLISDAYEVNH